MESREGAARDEARRALGLYALGRAAEARASLAKARAADAGDVVADSLRVTLAGPPPRSGVENAPR
jgi:hypothetical protein